MQTHRVVFFTGLEISLEDLLDTAEKVHKMDRYETTQAFLHTSRHPRLFGFEFKDVEREVMVDAEKLFDGTEEQALKAGWQENEFGFVCVTCAGEQEEDPDVESMVGLGDALIKTALEAVLPKPTQVLTTDALSGDGSIDIDIVIENLLNLPEEQQAPAARAAVQKLEDAVTTADPEQAASLRQTIDTLNNFSSED